MFPLLKLACLVLLKPYKVTDKESCRKFLFDMIPLIKPLAAKTETKLDDELLKHLTFVLNNDALFDYVYRLIFDQLQTEEILFESAVEGTVLELCIQGKNHPEGLRAHRTHGEDNPETINPIVIISLVTQLISLINTMKNR